MQAVPIICAEITKVSKHPNADRLRVCQVDTGEETVQVHLSPSKPICLQAELQTRMTHIVVHMQVVTNAPNVREGQKVAFAVSQ